MINTVSNSIEMDYNQQWNSLSNNLIDNNKPVLIQSIHQNSSNNESISISAAASKSTVPISVPAILLTQSKRLNERCKSENSVSASATATAKTRDQFQYESNLSQSRLLSAAANLSRSSTQFQSDSDADPDPDTDPDQIRNNSIRRIKSCPLLDSDSYQTTTALTATLTKIQHLKDQIDLIEALAFESLLMNSADGADNSILLTNAKLAVEHQLAAVASFRLNRIANTINTRAESVNTIQSSLSESSLSGSLSGSGSGIESLNSNNNPNSNQNQNNLSQSIILPSAPLNIPRSISENTALTIDSINNSVPANNNLIIASINNTVSALIIDSVIVPTKLRLIGNSCHQCKTLRTDTYDDLIHCGKLFPKKLPIRLNNNNNQPVSYRVCRKKYCARCLIKFYGYGNNNNNNNNLPKSGPGNAPEYICPGCMNICSCASCRKLSNDLSITTAAATPATPAETAAAAPSDSIELLYPISIVGNNNVTDNNVTNSTVDFGFLIESSISANSTNYNQSAAALAVDSFINTNFSECDI